MAMTREREIETNQYIAQYAADAGKECIETALDQLRRMVEDITRELGRPENDLHKKLYHFRHTLAWGTANIESNLANADARAMDLVVAKVRLEVLGAK